MVRTAALIHLTREERQTLKAWIRSALQQQRLAERARVVLLAAEGRSTEQIASALGTRPARVSKWRTRFAARGMSGLADGVKAGRPARYSAAVETRILELLEQPPPAGRRSWTGRLIADVLGDLSVDQVWRVLRARGVHLARRRGQYVEVDAEFSSRQVDIIGLYLHRAASAIVVSAAARPAVAPRCFVRVPDSRLARVFRTGVQQRRDLVGTLEAASALVETGQFAGPGRRDLARFVKDVIAACGHEAVHLVFVGEPGDVPPCPGLAYHVMPSYEHWLTQVECWFAALERGPAGAGSALRLVQAIDRFISAVREREAPAFEWRKAAC